MRDGPLIVTGLVLFLAVATFPVWYNMAARADAAAPVVARPSDAAMRRVSATFGPSDLRTLGRCVAPRDYMRASHMQLLVSWREDVVRRGDRMFIAYNRFRHEKNLTATCLGCHENKAQFCDRCHDYAGVSPGCPECHKK